MTDPLIDDTERYDQLWSEMLQCAETFDRAGRYEHFKHPMMEPEPRDPNQLPGMLVDAVISYDMGQSWDAGLSNMYKGTVAAPHRGFKFVEWMRDNWNNDRARELYKDLTEGSKRISRVSSAP